MSLGLLFKQANSLILQCHFIILQLDCLSHGQIKHRLCGKLKWISLILQINEDVLHQKLDRERAIVLFFAGVVSVIVREDYQ